jgi:hypothetical protein
MQIKYSPQCSDKTISYQFQGETVIATLNGESQTVDLSEITQYPEFNENEQQTIELPFFILSVRMIDGVKRVELLKFHKENAPENERFGFDWEEV